MPLFRRRTALGLVLLAACAASARAQAPRPAADEVFYHFMPIAWRDSDNDTYRFGDFGGMSAALDYLEYLGVTAVWMNPVFPSPAYHGYQHNRADELNGWFGDEAAFVGFVGAAHARGIKVFVDDVCYGINRDNPWFQDAYGDPGSPYDDWFAFTNSQNTQYLGSTYTTWNGSTVRFVHWNLNNPGPVALVTQWARHWLDPNGDGDPTDGIDGYRLDHVWVQYPQGPNGWGYNIDDFWIPWKQALQQVNPNVFTFAEQADWGSHGAELLPAHDAAMTKPFEFAARDALVNESAAGLYSQMQATLAALPPTGNFVGIIGDHDVDRLTTVIGGSLEKAEAAAAVLLTQPFPPIIYFGDELGMLGAKNTSYMGDAADIPMREPFKWNAVAGPPMSNYFALYWPAWNGRYARDNDGRSVEEQLGVAGSLLEEYRRLIAARHAHVALRRGDYFGVPNSSGAVWAFVRHHAEQQLLVAINLRGGGEAFTLDMSAYPISGGATTPTDVLTGATLPPLTDANKAAYPLTLPAYAWRILAIEVGPPVLPPGVDGRDIPADFAPLLAAATQNNATGMGDNVCELNQLFVRRDAHPDTGAEVLYLGLTGNLATDGTALALFLDGDNGGGGGQNVLDTGDVEAPPAGVAELTGLRFDAGFTPEHLVWMNAWSGSIYVDQFELLAGGGTNRVYRGAGTVNDGDGHLSGGTNPNGMQVALDNSNTAGVTDTDAAAAATAVSGFEILVPFGDIGLEATAADVRLAAFLVCPSGQVGNQFLPGLGGGYDNLGLAPDLTAIPADQFARVRLDPTGDLNCDGVINALDINPFVLAMVNPGGYAGQYPGCDWQRADCNGDGVVNALDINPFVRLLVGV